MKTHQKILILKTNSYELRSEIMDQSCEDTNNIKQDINIKFSDVGKCKEYFCPIEAIADNWRLIGPPFKIEKDDKEYYIWFLEKISHE